MALKIQSSFTAGELDPALHERTTLEKYKSALKTARNVVVGKTGRLISRGGRKFFVKAKTQSKKCKIHTCSHSGTFLEWGHQYVRVYTIDGTLVGDYAHALTEDDLDDVQFVNVEYYYVVIFCGLKDPLVLVTSSGGGFVTTYFDVDAAPSLTSDTVAGTGYLVQYALTMVRNGQESLALETSTSNPKIPINVGESNIIIAQATGTTHPQEMRVYRRPLNAGAYGYIGSSTYIAAAGLNWRATFTDYGADADYTHSPPAFTSEIKDNALSGPVAMKSKTGTYFQQRLIMSHGDKIVASRVGFPGNFYRDYPLAADSALSLRAGSEGYALILRMIDSDGLVAFTSQGVFVHTGIMTETNLSLDKKGSWVIDYRVPPIAIPGGVLFIDSSTNTVRELRFSLENGSYIGEELSIFNNHLFQGNRIKSWAFQDGEVPLLFVIFIDGTFASFTYEREHLMKAWTRHDSGNDVEYVASMTNGINQISSENTNPEIIFVTKNSDGWRYIELGIPRYVSADTAEEDLEYDKNESIAYMDAVVSWKYLINDHLIDDAITVTPNSPGQWNNSLTISCVNDGVFTIASGAGEVGRTLRFFNPVDRTSIDLLITARASNNSITVTPSETFPEEYATTPNLYVTTNEFSGLSHLEGENVSIIVDGAIVASPFNDIENYDTYTVSGGEIQLNSPLLGAIVHIGRPIIGDVETLDIDTVEQRPTLIESKTVNKVYIKTLNSRGLYVCNRFPSDDYLSGSDVTGTNMVTANALDSYDVNYEEEDPIVGNRYDQPKSRRTEVMLPGDWNSQGRVCLRQVDPVHFEILSIIPDMDDQRRAK